MDAPDRDRPAADDGMVILIPLYNDWTALGMLLAALDDVLNGCGIGASVLVVDDGSTTRRGPDFAAGSYRALRRVDVLGLRRNLGHQRALAIGLAYLEDRGSCATVVVMDGDGEDDPRDVPRLLARCAEEGGRKIVFAERSRRSESAAFRVFYALYKVVHHLLTGYAVRVGNFSAIPRERLASLVVVAELWNHYAAAAFRSRQPRCSVPTRRARRLHGRSSMDFVGLVTHGLSAISVYSEIIGVRMLVVSLALIVLLALGVIATVLVRLARPGLAVPGWAGFAVGVLLILLMQAGMLALIFSFVTLSGRQGAMFLPRRDYAHFIADLETAWPRPHGRV